MDQKGELSELEAQLREGAVGAEEERGVVGGGVREGGQRYGDL